MWRLFNFLFLVIVNISTKTNIILIAECFYVWLSNQCKVYLHILLRSPKCALGARSLVIPYVTPNSTSRWNKKQQMWIHLSTDKKLKYGTVCERPGTERDRVHWLILNNRYMIDHIPSRFNSLSYLFRFYSFSSPNNWIFKV